VFNGMNELKHKSMYKVLKRLHLNNKKIMETKPIFFIVLMDWLK